MRWSNVCFVVELLKNGGGFVLIFLEKYLAIYIYIYNFALKKNNVFLFYRLKYRILGGWIKRKLRLYTFKQ